MFSSTYCMLSPSCSTLPTLTIGTNVGVSISTSRSSGLTRRLPLSCARADMALNASNTTNSIMLRLLLYIFIYYFSEYNICTIVCPTALSVARSMCSIVSFMVCHVGPNELCWQSG